MSFRIVSGRLFLGEFPVGDSSTKRGFQGFVFDEELGSGATGSAFLVWNLELQVEQVIKVCLCRGNPDGIERAREEARRNANTNLRDVIAVVFAAGEYRYPSLLFYSVMELIPNSCTIKRWRLWRDENEKMLNFPDVVGTEGKNIIEIQEDMFRNNSRLDSGFRSVSPYMRFKGLQALSLNLAAGFLDTVRKLYEQGTYSGDLNPGNVLWVRNEGQSIPDQLSDAYSSIGVCNPSRIKLIDLLTNVNPEEVKMRDSWLIYDQIRSFLTPFCNENVRFNDWLNFDVDKVNKRLTDRKGRFISPEKLVGDFVRLVCVMTIAMGISFNENDADSDDRKDFRMIMNGVSFDLKLSKVIPLSLLERCTERPFNSKGNLIAWEVFWMENPFDINPFVERPSPSSEDAGESSSSDSLELSSDE